MHSNIGALIWVALVIFGVVSSIIRSARRGQQQQQQPRQQPSHQPQRRSTQPRAVREFMPPPSAAPQRPVPAPAATPLPPWLAAALSTVAEPERPKATPAPVTPPPVVPRAVTPPPAAPLPPQRTTIPTHPRPEAGVLRGLFEDRNSLIRAIVAAEVLGPPIALREQSIWSPLHNEPSI
jgi:hypothetical protein